LSATARKNLERHNIPNVTLATGNAALGWSANAPYDAIVLTGSVPVLPAGLQEQLAIGGRLFAVIGEAPVMEATLIRRVADQAFRTDVLFETCVPELTGAPQPERFSF
jgi:protein-L-isoaspartate(D-aspartate) O-methyltransferase